MQKNRPQPDPNLISEDDFVEIWGAHGKEGCEMFTFDDVRDLPINTVWTVVTGEDDSLYAAPGFHVVNREGYVVTSKPWTDDGQLAYWFFDDFAKEESDEEEKDDHEDRAV